MQEYFEIEYEEAVSGQSVETVVRSATEKRMIQSVQEITDQRLDEILQYLGFQSGVGLGPQEILRRAYSLFDSYYWYERVIAEGKKARILRHLSKYFRVGVGDIVAETSRSVVFPLYGSCPAVSGFSGDLALCKRGCQERSRLGVFTNTTLVRLLRRFHPALRLRLDKFRDQISGPCYYSLVLEF